jgi:hypothetical protein
MGGDGALLVGDAVNQVFGTGILLELLVPRIIAVEVKTLNPHLQGPALAAEIDRQLREFKEMANARLEAKKAEHLGELN